MGLRRVIFGPSKREKEEMIEDVKNRVANGEGCAWCGGRIGTLIYWCSYRSCETLPFCSDRCVYEHEAARHGTT
jgi:hypothetical protein